MIRCRQAGRVRRMARIVVGWNGNSGHGDVLMHHLRRSAVALVRHIAGRWHASVLVLWRNLIVRRRIIRVVVLIHGVHRMMVLRHILRLLLGSPSRKTSLGARHVHVWHPSSCALHVLPSRQMMAVAHRAGVGIGLIRASRKGDATASTISRRDG